MRKDIPKRNYIIVILLLIAIAILTKYMASWYRTIKDYNQNNSLMVDTIKPIELETIESYAMDNSNFVIYLASSKDQEVKPFEKKFKKYVKNKNLTNKIVYLDSDAYEKDYLTELLLSNKAFELKNLKKITSPNLLYFEDGKLRQILYLKNTNITKDDAIKFIEKDCVLND